MILDVQIYVFEDADFNAAVILPIRSHFHYLILHEVPIIATSTLRLIEQTQHKLQTAVQCIEQLLSSSCAVRL